MAQTVTFTVSFELPKGCSKARARAYVEDAVKTWAGSLDPGQYDSGCGEYDEGDPMFDLQRSTVKVKHHKEPDHGKVPRSP